MADFTTITDARGVTSFINPDAIISITPNEEPNSWTLKMQGGQAFAIPSPEVADIVNEEIIIMPISDEAVERIRKESAEAIENAAGDRLSQHR